MKQRTTLRNQDLREELGTSPVIGGNRKIIYKWKEYVGKLLVASPKYERGTMNLWNWNMLVA